MTRYTTSYIYSAHKTRDAAEIALESYFAEGIVSAAEQPYVQYNRSGRWLVMFREAAA